MPQAQFAHPPQVHFIGALLPAAPRGFEPPAWWGELGRGRPVVLVNQGTAANDPNELLIPALRALEGEGALVVVAAGGMSAHAAKGAANG